MVHKSNIVLGLSVLAGIGLVVVSRLLYTHVSASQVKFTPHEVHTILQPPENAVQAIVDNVKGEVSKEGRNDAAFHSITKPDTLIQGESLATQKGSVGVLLGQHMLLSLGSNTQLDYLTGLPGQMVVRQPMGTILYNISTSDDLPFSVRSLGLLTQFTQPTKATITTDVTSQTVSVVVSSGSASLAYSDENDTTQVETLQKGERALFDYTTYTLTPK